MKLDVDQYLILVEREREREFEIRCGRGKTGVRQHLYVPKGMRGMCDVTRYQGD